ncbi:hypothetical protein ACWDPV_04320 [Gordonia sp. NPDC003504]
MGTSDPAGLFKSADLEGRRRIIDIIAAVTLLAVPQGRRGFDPATVRLAWK